MIISKNHATAASVIKATVLGMSKRYVQTEVVLLFNIQSKQQKKS